MFMIFIYKIIQIKEKIFYILNYEYPNKYSRMGKNFKL